MGLETAESTLRSAILKTNYYFAKRARVKAERARQARAVQHRSERMERSSSLDDFTSDVMNSISAFKETLETENSRCSSNNELDTIEETDDDWKEARLTASSPKSLLEVSYEEIDNLLDMSRGIIDSMTGIDQIETMKFSSLPLKRPNYRVKQSDTVLHPCWACWTRKYMTIGQSAWKQLD